MYFCNVGSQILVETVDGDIGANVAVFSSYFGVAHDDG